jgi:hypothetical protein
VPLVAPFTRQSPPTPLRHVTASVPLYNAVYRFDDQMLVTPYLYRLHGYQHPLLHLKRLGPAGIFESYAQQFEAIWAESHSLLASSGGPRPWSFSDAETVVDA